MTDAEFAEAKKFWLMFQANETFKAVYRGCLESVSSGLSQDSPLYFPLVAGLICLYGRPFKKSEGVGKLPIEMVPKEYLDLHNDLITIRDKLYAHSDADKTVTLGSLHFGELRAYRYKYPKPEGGYFIDRLHIAPGFFTNVVAKLAQVMVQKTQYHVDSLGKKFAPRIPRRDGNSCSTSRTRMGCSLSRLNQSGHTKTSLRTFSAVSVKSPFRQGRSPCYFLWRAHDRDRSPSTLFLTTAVLSRSSSPNSKNVPGPGTRQKPGLTLYSQEELPLAAGDSVRLTKNFRSGPAR
jgi:hypothetical protein